MNVSHFKAPSQASIINHEKYCLNEDNFEIRMLLMCNTYAKTWPKVEDHHKKINIFFPHFVASLVLLELTFAFQSNLNLTD